MRIIIHLALLLCIFGVIRAQTNSTSILLHANSIPERQRTYNLRDNYCRLLAHTSQLVNEGGTNPVIVIDGGMAKYKFYWEGKQREVPDLNGEISILPLDKDFLIESPPLETIKKATNIAGNNRGYMWVDSIGNVLTAGGHFFDQAWWSDSAYYVPQGSIPGYSIWKFIMKDRQWVELDPLTDASTEITRMISSPYLSIPSTNTSYAYGGYRSERSDPNTGPNLNIASNGMLIYDHTTNRIRNQTDPNDSFGLVHGTLHHLEPKNKDHPGVVLALTAVEVPLQTNFSDAEVVGARAADFTTIKFFDIQTDSWHTQKASFFNNQRPIARTRFCSALVRNEANHGWDLWIYGGQQISDPTKGINDIWVLSMPAFIWIQIPNILDNVDTRGHTCHAIGQQMLIIGGIPPGIKVAPETECYPRLLRLFNMHTKEWGVQFKAASRYEQPDEVKTWTKGLKAPHTGFASSTIESIFESEGITNPPPPPTWKLIVPITIAVIFFLLIAGLAGWKFHKIWQRRREERRQRGDAEANGRRGLPIENGHEQDDGNGLHVVQGMIPVSPELQVPGTPPNAQGGVTVELAGNPLEEDPPIPKLRD